MEVPYVYRDVTERKLDTDLSQVRGLVHSRNYDALKGILIHQEQLQSGVAGLARVVNGYFKDHYKDGKDIVAVNVLKGAQIFYADLVRKLRLPLIHDTLHISSYEGTRSTGEYKVKKDLSESVKGKHVLLVEDIVDTGNSGEYMVDHINNKDPATITLVTLCDKPSRREANFEADFTAFSIPDHFIVGYGLDFDERYREMPFIGVLTEKAIEEGMKK